MKARKYVMLALLSSALLMTCLNVLAVNGCPQVMSDMTKVKTTVSAFCG